MSAIAIFNDFMQNIYLTLRNDMLMTAAVTVKITICTGDFQTLKKNSKNMSKKVEIILSF
jgi:hypothetical protein